MEEVHLVHKLVAFTGAHREAFYEKDSLTSELAADKVKVDYLEDDKLKYTVEVKKLSKANIMLQDHLDILKTSSGDILVEAGDMRLSNRSLEASVGFGRRAT